MNQTKVFMENGARPTLHSKCHHEIVYSKRNLKIEYSPSYTRKIWSYNRSQKFSLANIDLRSKYT